MFHYRVFHLFWHFWCAHMRVKLVVNAECPYLETKIRIFVFLTLFTRTPREGQLFPIIALDKTSSRA